MAVEAEAVAGATGQVDGAEAGAGQHIAELKCDRTEDMQLTVQEALHACMRLD